MTRHRNDPDRGRTRTAIRGGRTEEQCTSVQVGGIWPAEKACGCRSCAEQVEVTRMSLNFFQPRMRRNDCRKSSASSTGVTSGQDSPSSAAAELGVGRNGPILGCLAPHLKNIEARRRSESRAWRAIQPPRWFTHTTRPFETVWPLVQECWRTNTRHSQGTFGGSQTRMPEVFPHWQLRTLQRRVDGGQLEIARQLAFRFNAGNRRLTSCRHGIRPGELLK